MASIQKKGDAWYCQFRYRGQRKTFGVGRVSEAEARSRAEHVQYLLMRIEQGLVEAPADIVEYLRGDGKSAPSPVAVAVAGKGKGKSTLGSLRDGYLATHEGSLEPETMRAIRRHFAHLAAHFGPAFPIRKLTLADLQSYVDTRARAKGRRGRLNPATIKKEIVSLRTAWNWGVRMELVAGRTRKGLRYAKGDEKPPFQIRAEIERQLPGLSPAKAGELWGGLYLTLPEIGALLAHVKANALHPWIHPLVATAAHTGARKGELLRMRIGDVDFRAEVVTVREKKRAHDRRTTRRVPMSSALAAILKEWLAIHPGGPLLFAQSEVVAGSRKRSEKTGYRGRDRPRGAKARMAGVTMRPRQGILPLTETEAHHLRQSLKGGQ
jgi:integrase